MHEHPLIELYVTLDGDRQTEQDIASVDLDAIVLRTLETAGIIEQVMLTLLVTDDKGIREMNKQYREQDKATDVLSFPLLTQPLVQAPADQLWTVQADENTPPGATPEFVTPPGMITNLGDIVMSWPTIVKQAADAGHSALTELLYLLSHGVLHLIGYDDQTEAGYAAMVGIQRSVLQACGYRI